MMMMPFLSLFVMTTMTIMVQPAFAQVEADTCFYSNSTTNDCPLSVMTSRTLVYPQGETGCLRSTAFPNNDYFFQVQPGHSGNENKLLVQFQGGGICDGVQSNCPAVMAPRSIDKGVFDLTRPEGENPFASWTVLLIPYCTKDAHVGNSKTSSDSHGPLNFIGRVNTLVVLDWVQTNLPNLERLYLQGTSAGALGAEIWTHAILNSVKNKPGGGAVVTSSVLYDSAFILEKKFRGVPLPIPSATWASCDQATFQWNAALQAACQEGTLTWPMVQQYTMENHREVPFGMLTNKIDSASLASYCQTSTGFGPLCPVWGYYNALLDYFRGMTLSNNNNNNAITYLVNNQAHVSLNNNNLYLADAGAEYTLLEWVEELGNRDAASTVLVSQCTNWWAYLFFFGCDRELTQAEFRP